MASTTTFQEEIDQLMDRVAERYPEALIAERRARLRRFWTRRPAEGHIPYVVADFEPRGWPDVSPAYTEMQVNLIGQLRGIIDHADWNDDYVPLLQIGVVQATIPAFFGARERRAGGSVQVIPLIDDPGDAEKLHTIGFPPDSHGGAFLAKMRYFHEATRGAIPVGIADMQGPFSIASQVWGIEPFLLASYTDPSAVSLMCRRAAMAAAEYYRQMRAAVAGNWSPCHCFPILWMPPDAGVCLSEDMLAVVSPETTRKFINPGLAALGEAFGQVLVHTCGRLNLTAGALAEVETLTGVNCSSSETDVPKLARDMGGRFRYIIHHGGILDPALPALKIDEQVAMLRDVFGDRIAVAGVLMPTGPVSPKDDAERVRRAATW